MLENSKNAYLLVYEKNNKDNVKLTINKNN